MRDQQHRPQGKSGGTEKTSDLRRGQIEQHRPHERSGETRKSLDLERGRAKRKNTTERCRTDLRRGRANQRFDREVGRVAEQRDKTRTTRYNSLDCQTVYDLHQPNRKVIRSSPSRRTKNSTNYGRRKAREERRTNSAKPRINNPIFSKELNGIKIGQLRKAIADLEKPSTEVKELQRRRNRDRGGSKDERWRRRLKTDWFDRK